MLEPNIHLSTPLPLQLKWKKRNTHWRSITQLIFTQRRLVPLLRRDKRRSFCKKKLRSEKKKKEGQEKKKEKKSKHL